MKSINVNSQTDLLFIVKIILKKFVYSINHPAFNSVCLNQRSGAGEPFGRGACG
jgi:hypothetical protein